MRWRFADPNNREEAAQKARVMENIDAWWEAFVEDTDVIDGHFMRGEELDIPTWMQRHLKPIHHDLFWEFGPAREKQGHRLVITSEGTHSLRPVVQTIMERAPSLPRWEFYPYRLPESAEFAHQMVKSRLDASYPDATARLCRGAHYQIDITFRSRNFRSAANQSAKNAAFLFCELLLGEEALDRWVGVIEPAGDTSDDDSHRFVPLERVRPTFDALRDAIRSQLPQCSRYELDPQAGSGLIYEKRREGNPSAGRGDVFIGSASEMDLIRAAEAACFSSQRFSRCGEMFAYLKLDRGGIDVNDAVRFRSPFDAAVDRALRGARSGCTLGGATGSEYSYIDVALTDIDRAIDVIRSTLRPLLAPKRSWLLFFEPEYEQEWVGVWDDTPPPPAREDGSVG